MAHLKSPDVRIIREVEDDRLARDLSHTTFKEEAWLRWGLGDDNELYWTGAISGHMHPHSWVKYFVPRVGIEQYDFAISVDSIILIATELYDYM